ncbi:contractile injection system tape measure protein [Mucilaginibacter ginkgonis]|uniref:Uncharacterized protein n=1 Tax=Mucilaginibacter ginkgonis TaxID=2682091 RepID=A0A6I4HZT8_9SPHI|nr:contractile injection system tape measure protein [Mucilaginibacter ginkgonis]QQL48736.1 hypothetical protein GO620_011155 [Mucilaginibacter ginkgonis]
MVDELTMTSTVKKYGVNNAGIVLLNPFLPNAFKRLNFTDPDSGGLIKPHDAAAFLQNCVGADDESGAGLINLLCGLDLAHRQVKPAPNLDIQRLADELLQAVIANWIQLRNSSPTALKESFLQRPGHLSYTGHSWQLEVSNHSYDVVLQTCPWTFEEIKLPWMSTALSVSWAI